jgi:hypothetical protein
MCRTAPRHPHTRCSWTAAELEQLGQVSDAVLARRFRRSYYQVRRQRLALNIPARIPHRPHPPSRPWTAAELKLLGTMPDHLLARRLKRTVAAISNRRFHARIVLRPQWTKAQDKLLGTLPDEELARRFNRTHMAVSIRRRRLGHPKPVPKIPYWTPEEDQLLGTLSDREVARRLGRSEKAVTKRRLKRGIRACHQSCPWTSDQLAGWEPRPTRRSRALRDVPSGRFQLKRHQLGRRKVDSKIKYWSREEDQLLGTLPDAEVARRTERSIPAVRLRRLNTCRRAVRSPS